MVERVITNLDAGLTVFSELQTAEYSPDISINSTYGLTDYRLITTNNGGTIAEDKGSFRLRTGTTGTNAPTLETAEVGDYNSGSMGLAGLLVFRPTAPTGSQELTWGYYNDSNGILIGEDATDLFSFVRSGGSDQSKVYRTSFNVDRLDGTHGARNPSGLTIDLSLPHTWRLRMALYGRGPVELQVLMAGSLNQPIYVTLHRFTAEESELILQQWGLPVRADASNNGETTSIDLHVGGMQFGVIGQRLQKPRTVAETVFSKSLSGTTIVPIASYRKKNTDNGVNVRLLGFTPVSADDLQMLVILGGTLTGANFGGLTNVEAGETVLEVDTAATAISGGNALYEDIFPGGGGNKLTSPGERSLGLALPRNLNATLAARLFTGTGGSGSFTFRAEEGW